MIMARARQLAERETIQLTHSHPDLRREIDATKSSRIQKLIRQPSRSLPGLLHGRRQIFDHAINHRSGADAQMFTHLRQVLGGIAPVDEALTLVMTHRQPVTELELDACQIKFAANT